MAHKLVPDDFKIPEILITEKFKLRPLSPDDIDEDYNVVMSNIEHLQGVFGSDNPWPTKDMTKEQDLEDLEWHRVEFQNRTSFAYLLQSLDETKYLGCVYIYPSKNPSYDAILIFWIVKEEVANGLDTLVLSYLKKWIENDWPFEKVAYPGRDMTWDEFNSQA